uniref:splicing factor 3A subunit 2-like n=1 Tax=Panthera onca TaxID=9690 RepID=UPI002954A515|nr:splicing factor 3A subunit 2-like [Panthera onca]
MARGPDREIPPWRGQRSCQSISFFPRSALHGALSHGRPLSPFIGSGPTPSSPPWWPLGPHPPPPAFEPLADPEAGVTPVSHNNKHSTKNAKKDKAIMYARGPGPSPGSPCRLSPMDHPSPRVTGYGPPPLLHQLLHVLNLVCASETSLAIS